MLAMPKGINGPDDTAGFFDTLVIANAVKQSSQ